MRPLLYIDIQVRYTQAEDEFSTAIPIMARLVRCLHGYFAQNPNKFAIAFPQLRMGEVRRMGNMIRIFMETKDDFYGLNKWFQNNDRIAPYVQRR